MTDAEKAAEEIVDWLKVEGLCVGDCADFCCPDMDVLLRRIRQIIDKHLC